MIAGRYTLDREIGRGGMGAVWRGTDQTLGRTVALKRIGIAPGGGTPDVQRAEREARLAARLNHPHVVAVFDLVDDEADQQWMVMEHVEGTNLSEIVRANGALPPDQVAPDPGAGRRRPGRRARRRDRAPRREAVQHPGHPRRQREADRLRDRPHRGGRGADPDRAGHRLPGVPRARGRDRAAGHRGERRVVARRDAVPRADRQAAVRGRRQRDGRALPDRQRGAAATGQRRLAGAAAGGHDGQGPAQRGGRAAQVRDFLEAGPPTAEPVEQPPVRTRDSRGGGSSEHRRPGRLPPTQPAPAPRRAAPSGASWAAVAAALLAVLGADGRRVRRSA